MNGWKCPGCGRCYAPWVSECRNCTGTTIPLSPWPLSPSPTTCPPPTYVGSGHTTVVMT